MSIDVTLRDVSTKSRASVRQGAVLVRDEKDDPGEVKTENKKVYFSGFFGSTGIDSGTLDMSVDGSSTPQEFYITAKTLEYDVVVKRISFFIVDTTVTNSGWGALGALSNGVDVDYIGIDETISIVDTAAFVADFGRQLGTTFDEITSYNGTNQSQVINFDLDKIVDGGIRLKRQTKTQIKITINDNMVSMKEFSALAMGYRHYE